MAVDIYDVGTVAVTQGEKLITLTGGDWLEAWAVPGNQLVIAGETQANYVRNWISTSEVELVLPVTRTTSSGLAYSMLITAPAFGINRQGAMTNIERIRLMTENEDISALLGVAANAPIAPTLGDRLALWDASNGGAIGAALLGALLQSGSSLSAKSADYTVVTADYGATIAMSAGGGARIITLPLASSAGAGFLLNVKKVDSSSNPVMVSRGGTTIDGAASLVLQFQAGSASLVCDGTNWHIVAHSDPSPFMRTLIDDASAPAVLTTLGISVFTQTLLDDTTQGAARTTLGVGTSDASQFGSGAGVTQNQNAQTKVTVQNGNAGASAGSIVELGNNGASLGAYLGLNSSGAGGLIGGANGVVLANVFSAPIAVAVGGSERARFDGSSFKVGTSASLSGSGNDGLTGLDLKGNGTHYSHTSATPSCYFAKIAGYSNSFYHAYYVNGSLVGSVTTNGTSTAFNTSSDYRLKSGIEALMSFTIGEEEFGLMGESLRRIMLLNPVSYHWISEPDGPLAYGLIAHEVQAVIPTAVTGAKDEMEDFGTAVIPARMVAPAYIVPGAVIVQADADNGITELREPDIEVPATIEPEHIIENIPEGMAPEGSVWTKTGERPSYQGVDYSKTIPDLISAQQNLALLFLDLNRRLVVLEA